MVQEHTNPSVPSSPVGTQPGVVTFAIRFLGPVPGVAVALGVFVFVAEGVEVLAHLLGGGLVGEEQGSSPRGLAQVEADGGVGLRIGLGEGNLVQCLGVLRPQIGFEDGHRGVPVGSGVG